MADYQEFQSSKTAAEIEEVLTGAVLFNSNTDLSEDQKAQARANIGASASGEGIKIVSHFDTLEELEAAVPKPNSGDAFSVGTELPYNLYIFDFFNGLWRNYGPIRANDIKARFAQNSVVAVSSWVNDPNVFVDYPYKAAIPLAELTGNDFPIVAFAPSDATGGNFCPVAYAFDGCVEIWARAIPSVEIIVPAMTFILQDTEDGATGNSTKGITNASGGFATGGIGADQIANGAVTSAKLSSDAKSKSIAVSLTVDAWVDNSQTVAVDGVTAINNIVVAASPGSYDEYCKCLVRATEQAENAVIFACAKQPENNIVAHVLIIP